MVNKLARAVMYLFRDGATAQFPAFSVREWERTYYWLDASGMSLYLLERLRTLQLTHMLPMSVHRRLVQNYADNSERSQDMLHEFVRINGGFAQMGMRYANLKGFSLTPDFVPDYKLRYQSDLDLLLDFKDAPRAADFLHSLGYRLQSVDSPVWEFKTNADSLPAISDLYKPNPQRCVELHFIQALDASAFNLLDRVQKRHCNGYVFPALSEADRFLGMSMHLFRHLRSEWTRLSWLLEYKNFLVAHKQDHAFWSDLQNAATISRTTAIAIGCCTLTTEKSFGESLTPETRERATFAVPAAARLWIEQYSDVVLLANYPGTKLYLLLEEAVTDDAATAKRIKKHRLLPLHSMTKITQAPAGNDTLRGRGRRALWQIDFFVLRLRFHVIQGFRYLLEAQRWKRILAVS